MSLSHPAVAYSLEADADHRKNGLIPRVTFSEPSDSDSKYESKGTITLDSKGKEQCVTRRLVIQVATPFSLDLKTSLTSYMRTFVSKVYCNLRWDTANLM